MSKFFVSFCGNKIVNLHLFLSLSSCTQNQHPYIVSRRAGAHLKAYSNKDLNQGGPFFFCYISIWPLKKNILNVLYYTCKSLHDA